MKRALRWIVTLAALAGIVGGAVWYRRTRKPPSVHYETVKAERGRLVAKVTATGTLSALVTVQVGTQVSGRIAQLFADFNSPVKKGQVLAKIDPQLFNAAVEQARANVAAQAAQVDQAKVNARNLDLQRKRSRELRKSNLVAQQDLDTAEAAADAAAASIRVQEGQLQQARAALHQAEVNLAYTTIFSPTDGTVISRNVDVGQTVAASLQAPVLFTIAQDLKKMQVDTNVAEADVGRLWAGMPASFTVDAYSTERFKGKVRQIRNAPQTVQNVVTYDAVIDVDNGDLKLRPGMTANVTFVYAEKGDVLEAPNAALRFRPPPEMTGATPGQHGASGGAGGGGRGARSGHGAEAADHRTLWVLRGGSARAVSVRIGVSDGTSTEIVEGDVQPGDALITEATGGEGGKGPGGQPNPFRRMF
ncbi:MAG TPA: efflux RND transporter periplasmic adaptor subunit [Polyangiaceae bacterium]|nr:efflux RND transporter periplasmic adaptor subunit [Polyangiaceae bacterium]